MESNALVKCSTHSIKDRICNTSDEHASDVNDANVNGGCAWNLNKILTYFVFKSFVFLTYDDIIHTVSTFHSRIYIYMKDMRDKYMMIIQCSTCMSDTRRKSEGNNHHMNTFFFLILDPIDSAKLYELYVKKEIKNENTYKETIFAFSWYNKLRAKFPPQTKRKFQ